jgi:hypothetical protein
LNFNEYCTKENLWKYFAVGSFAFLCAHVFWTKWSKYNTPSQPKKHKKKHKSKANEHGIILKKLKAKRKVKKRTLKHDFQQQLERCQTFLDKASSLQFTILRSMNSYDERFAAGMMPLQAGHKLLSDYIIYQQSQMNNLELVYSNIDAALAAHQQQIIQVQKYLKDHNADYVAAPINNLSRPPSPANVPPSPRGNNNLRSRLNRIPSGSALHAVPTVILSDEQEKKPDLNLSSLTTSREKENKRKKESSDFKKALEGKKKREPGQNSSSDSDD